MLRLIGWLLLLGGILGAVGEVQGWELPTVRWPFHMSRELGPLRGMDVDGVPGFPWFGWLWTGLVILLGLWMVIRLWSGTHFSPITLRRMERFREIKRGYYSLIIILVLAAVASLDHVLVGSEALAVKYDGKWTYPAFSRTVEKGKDYGVDGEGADAPADYRFLQRSMEKEGSKLGRVIMPLLQYDPTGDTITSVSTPLEEREGVLYEGNERFNGWAARSYDPDVPERRHVRYKYREGVRAGEADGWTEAGERVYGAIFKDGKLKPGSVSWNGEGSVEDFLAIGSSPLGQVHFPPAPPTIRGSSVHLLGTTPQGADVVAYLFGGLQVNFKAALFYIPVVYLLGVTIGLLMGYFGGVFDLVVQRLIEILSNIPFLFVVMIASTAIPPKLKESAGLWIILGILVLFGWMGMTYVMRTAALKEKARDYIAASRVIGAGTPRILFRHLLPNSIAIVVTLIPFSVSALILSLTSLDYLGFGLPPKYATWGRLLGEGLRNLSSPWLVSSAFLVLVTMLVLVTFVGEAVREAFDPKKFSYYR